MRDAFGHPLARDAMAYVLAGGRGSRLNELTERRLPIFNGSNPLILEALRVGATGWCTAAPCLRPRLCLELFSAAAEGRFDRAGEIYESLRPLLQFIVAGGLPVTVKSGLDILGASAGDPRAPLLRLKEADRAQAAALPSPLLLRLRAMGKR